LCSAEPGRLLLGENDSAHATAPTWWFGEPATRPANVTKVGVL